ncbi:MAG: hypothetical protein BWY09_02381 [Candidatus Hydrogenedentes bacterium ADurb.Bin179]|nr:MAG: hypothetical protein BWY09_02381 [Candidatus Hydrogenedentes bacterium ADurb.Bin179]
MIGGPDADDAPALVHAQPFRHRADAGGPAGRLKQPVERHEYQERGVGIGEAENDVAGDGKAQPAQEQHARPPAASRVTAEKLADHVGDKKGRPDMGRIAQFPAQLRHNGHLAEGKHLAGEIKPDVAHIRGNENTPSPVTVVGGEFDSHRLSSVNGPGNVIPGTLKRVRALRQGGNISVYRERRVPCQHTGVCCQTYRQSYTLR